MQYNLYNLYPKCIIIIIIINTLNHTYIYTIIFNYNKFLLKYIFVLYIVNIFIITHLLTHI